MDLKHPDGTKISLPLAPRSLLVMTGDSRFLWRFLLDNFYLTFSHGINARKTDNVDNVILERNKRTSITFRKVRQEKDCHCHYQAQCDSWLTTHKGRNNEGADSWKKAPSKTTQRSKNTT